MWYLMYKRRYKIVIIILCLFLLGISISLSLTMPDNFLSEDKYKYFMGVVFSYFFLSEASFFIALICTKIEKSFLIFRGQLPLDENDLLIIGSVIIFISNGIYNLKYGISSLIFIPYFLASISGIIGFFTGMLSKKNLKQKVK